MNRRAEKNRWAVAATVLVVGMAMLAFPNSARAASGARYVGTLGSRPIILNDSVSSHDTNDYFRFSLRRGTRVTITLTNYNDNANLGLYDSRGRMLGLSTRLGRQTDQVVKNLGAGSYTVRVASYKKPPRGPWSNTNYTLRISSYSPKPAPRPVLNRPVTPRPSPRPVVTRPATPRPNPRPRVGTTVIRGIRYQDHSAGTSLSPSTTSVSGSFSISSSTLNFNTRGTLKVVLQDVARPGNSFGVTAFQLRNVRRVGNRLIVQGPGLPLFRNRTFHVSVFIYTGSQNLHANAGRITFR